EACTGARLEVCTGKPDPIMLRAALQGLEVAPADCVMVGDRLGTDIRMAIDAGMPSVLVLTGDTRAEDVAALSPRDRPTYVVERLDQLLPPR
ncbi:MAG: HAD-IA family hydrolase, partial [Candidatus Dormibacteraeota bacterium]|nr:HAD-IA family hydrolase [Candidatus Dormibacteraeota bacterium]